MQVVICRMLKMMRLSMANEFYPPHTGVLIMLTHSWNLTHPLTPPQTGGTKCPLAHTNQKQIQTQPYLQIQTFLSHQPYPKKYALPSQTGESTVVRSQPPSSSTQKLVQIWLSGSRHMYIQVECPTGSMWEQTGYPECPKQLQQWLQLQHISDR